MIIVILTYYDNGYGTEEGARLRYLVLNTDMRSVGCCSVSLTLLGFHGRACQVPLSMEFSRQEYWSGLPFPSLGDLPDPGIGPTSPELAGGFFTTAPPGKPI